VRSSTARPRARGRPVALLLAAALAAAAAAGCGGDADASEGGADEIGLGARPGLPDDADELRTEIEQLLAERDRVVGEIVADPAVAGDPGHPLVQELTDLYEPDSEEVAAALATWAGHAEAGERTLPATEGRPAFATRLDGEIERLGGDEVRFPICNEHSYAVLDAADQLVEMQPGVDMPGEGTAVRVDGRWRLRQLTVEPVTGCRQEEP
jgi:hypothetical protein